MSDNEMFQDETYENIGYVDVNAVFNDSVSSDAADSAGTAEMAYSADGGAADASYSSTGSAYDQYAMDEADGSDNADTLGAGAAYSGETGYSGASSYRGAAGAKGGQAGRNRQSTGTSVVRKVLPHDTNAEKAVVGSMMMDREAITDIADLLLPEDFYNASYGVIFETICELYQGKRMVDIVTLMDGLKKKNIPEEINNVSFLGDIINSVPTTVNAKQYAEIVRDKAILRRLIKLSDDISTDCYQQQDSVENILERAEQDVFRLAQTRNGYNDFAGMSSIVLEVIDGVDKAARNKGKINGLSTGFIDLDEKLTGLHGGELIIVAARPSMGKTALVLNIAHSVAVKQHIPVLFFSLEMGKKELGDRIVAQDAMIDAKAMKTGDLADEDWVKLAESVGVVGDAPLFVDDNSAVTVAEMRSKCRKFKQKNGLGLIIIDYLQLMTPNRAVESRQQFISDVSRSLKGLARELNVPIIALSQLNRAVDSRTDHRPVLADLRESGAIEQDADVVMFIYRDEFYNPETEKPGIAEIIVAKQRAGSTGKVELIWQGKYTRFANCAR